MGIHTLLPFLKKFSKKTNIRKFSGQTAAIDASCWLHKGLSVSLAQSGRRERCVDIFQNYLRSVKGAGVIPFVVFDGLPLPAKASECERRRRDKDSRLARAEQPNISLEEANKLRSQAVEITFGDVTECINLCLAEKVNYIVSPYESDAQIAFLLSKGYADFVLTEDSDLLAYGCKKVMVKASMNGEGDVFDLDEILEGLKVNMKQFQEMCIAAGCDYLKNVRGVGIHRAHEMVSSGNLLEELAHKGADDEYRENFHHATAVFQHQTVFDLESFCTVPLKKWDTDPSMNIQYLCGYNLDDLFANELAVGNVDIKSQNKVNSYPLFKKATTRTGSDGQVASLAHPGTAESDGDSNNLHCEIIHVDKFSSFNWKIPCLRVMTLKFSKVIFKDGTEIRDGVIEKGKAAAVERRKYLCTSHCQIEVAGIKYTVLWEFTPTDKAAALSSTPSVPQSNASDDTDSEENDDDEQDDDNGEQDDDNDEPADQPAVETDHCLPFKVMGTCYSGAYQKSLEEAFEHLYKHNRPVFAKLEAEPDNPHDSHAIAVHVMSTLDYEKVGYIAQELTRFVHPVLNDPALRVSVKKIRFCTTFLKIGFYLTIEITRKGLWEKPVIKASRKVR